MLPAVFLCLKHYERFTMYIQKIGQDQIKSKKGLANSFTGKKELLQDLINIAYISQKSSIIEDSSPIKKIELTSANRTYTLISRVIENFKNIFSYKKQPAIVHELMISENGKKSKILKLKSDEFTLTYNKLREIVIPQVLKQVNVNVITPSILLKTIGQGLLNENIHIGKSFVGQGTNHYLQIGKTFQLPNKNTVSIKHYFRNDIIEDNEALPEINLLFNNSEKNEFVVSKKQERELFADTLKLDDLIASKRENGEKLETLKNEAQKINQELDDFQNNFETNINEANKQIEAFKNTFVI